MEHKKFSEMVNKFLDESGLSQAELARSVGLSPAVVSTLRGGTYKGDSAGAISRIKNYCENYNKKESKNIEIETSQGKLAKFVISKAISEKKMAVIYGDAGSGKSTLCKSERVRRGGGVYVECDAYLTTRGLFKRICDGLNITGKRSLSETLEEICNELNMRETVLYVDEAEYLSAKSLEMLRRIWDFSNTPIIFIGIHRIVENLKKHRQLYSRIKWKWELQPLKTEDIVQLAAAYEIESNESVVHAIEKFGKANFRSCSFLCDNSKELSAGDVVSVEVVSNARSMLLL